MNENIIFTEKFIENYNEIGYHFDRDYRRTISTNPAFDGNRKRLESFIEKYPEPFKSRWVKEFQNFKIPSCKPCISELKAHYLLVKAFGEKEVNIEPEIKNTLKRPDFLVRKSIAVEVFAVMDIDSPTEQKIYEIISNLDTNLSFDLDKVQGINDTKPPSYKQFIASLEKIISERAKIVEKERFDITFSNGIRVSGFISNDNLNGAAFRTIGTKRNYTPSIKEYERLLRKKIRNRIRGKLKKYNNLRHLNMSVVLIIDDWISHVFSSKLEWEQIFDGMETRDDIKQNKDTSLNRIWTKSKNRGLSMILVRAKTRGNNCFHYFKNEFALNPVSEQDLIKFKENFIDSEG